MQLDSGAIIAGKYRLEHPLSAGGMGSVWVAQHVQLGTHVAVKFMGTAYAGAPAFRARFEREARAAAHLRSPHVVQVHDFGFEQSVPYLVMELLRGEDLSKRLSRVRRLPLGETQRLLVQAGKALRSVHDAGLVHRDLKPANLFLARVDGEDEDLLKLIDFGIAKETAPKLVTEASTTGEVMGSPHYMSPEQLRADRDVDARSDLWAMGVILFRMVTGYLPFPGEVLAQVMTKILVEPIPSARQLAPDLPVAIDAFFARALAREKAHRFQNVREMVEEFGRAIGMTAVFSSSGVGGSSPFGWAGAPGVTGAVGAGAGGAGGAVAGTAAPGGYGGPSYPAAPAQVPGGGDGKTAVAQEPSPGTLTDAVHVAGPSRPRSRGARAAWIIAGSAGIAAVGLGLGVMLQRVLEVPAGPGGEAGAAAEAKTGAAAPAEGEGAVAGTEASAATKVEASAATNAAATGTAAGTGPAVVPAPEASQSASGAITAASAPPEPAPSAAAASPGTGAPRPAPQEAPSAAAPHTEATRTTPDRPRTGPSEGRGAPTARPGNASGGTKQQPDWGF
ncbi:protein kinase [Sorangium cellulosum]|uniref:Protein kinase n=1 Tax=Sorangium cellulosum TaxID=56 RepID=A0A2L0EN28_SORCE|nr:serine/threonine-protein kinase [Sorangium cellulosum]AUX40714.1 protein kinase [Sorangium cellulosum]